MFQDLMQAVINGDASKVKRLCRQLLSGNAKANQLLAEALLPGMDEVGRRFKEGEYFLPHVILAGKAMEAGMEELRPLLSKSDRNQRGKIALGTVQGDLHDIGKNLVGMLITGGGFEVVNLGRDVPPQRFVEAVRDQQVQVIGMSALLTTTMPVMGRTIQALKDADLRHKTLVMVGGAPVSQRFADEIGADGYASDAPSAVELAKKLLGIN
jgi:5-methyltetrahydrofolate--homocysteine methyltransferase